MTDNKEYNDKDNHKTTMDNEDNHHKAMTGTETETDNNTTQPKQQ
jgi:hypothetical protein